MNPSLMGYEAAVLGTLDDAGRRTVADELTALESLVGADPALRSALTDSSVPGGARRAVVTDLLDGKVHPATARIAAFAAGSSSAQDVPLGLTEAAQRARGLVEDGAIYEPGLSVLASRARVGGYASAIFEDQHLEGLEGIEDELFGWAQSVQDNAQLRGVLTNRDLGAVERAAVVRELLAGRGSPVTISLAAYAVVGGRARDLVGTLQWLVDRVAEERGWRVARVHSARAIDDDSRERLSATLRTLVGRPVELEVAEQPSLLGGVLVEVGDLRVDATTRGRLDALREQLTNVRREPMARATN